MSIIVTGGSGFIGSNFVLEWINKEDDLVINLDKLTYAGNNYNLSSLENNKKYLFMHGDIGDSNLVLKILKEFKPKYIVNFAAESHVDRSINNPDCFIKTNINGSQNVIEAASDCGVKNIISLSTDKASSPINLYGATKLCSDKLFIAANRYSGNKLKCSVVRYGNGMG